MKLVKFKNGNYGIRKRKLGVYWFYSINGCWYCRPSKVEDNCQFTSLYYAKSYYDSLTKKPWNDIGEEVIFD